MTMSLADIARQDGTATMTAIVETTQTAATGGGAIGTRMQQTTIAAPEDAGTTTMTTTRPLAETAAGSTRTTTALRDLPGGTRILMEAAVGLAQILTMTTTPGEVPLVAVAHQAAVEEAGGMALAMLDLLLFEVRPQKGLGLSANARGTVRSGGSQRKDSRALAQLKPNQQACSAFLVSLAH